MSLRLRFFHGASRARLQLRLTISSARAASGTRWPLTLTAVAAVSLGAALLLPPTPVPYPYAELTSTAYPAPELPQPWPQSVAVGAQRVVDGRFGRGSTLAGELSRAGVPSARAYEVVTAASEGIDLRRIRDGQEYKLYFDENDELSALRYQVDRRTAWFVALEADAWQAMKVVIPVTIEPRFISATIGSTLEAALVPSAQNGRGTHDLILKVADVYGWDVDFNYDLRPGDRLDVVVEERFVEGEFAGYGDVLAAEFRVLGRTLPVVRFADSDGRTSYYNPGGESLRRAFLRSPVKYQRISSRFSPRRVHPVTGIARAHRGVDYAADPGTPVQATADGVVLTAAYGAEPGRHVKIRHGGSYSSVYMHLSRYAEGMKAGVNVKQGDVIGYVGKSGNATGYHLHYGLVQGERYVDPIRMQVPAADPVDRDSWIEFATQRDRWLQLLRAGQSRLGQQVAGVVGGA